MRKKGPSALIHGYYQTFPLFSPSLHQIIVVTRDRFATFAAFTFIIIIINYYLFSCVTDLSRCLSTISNSSRGCSHCLSTFAVFAAVCPPYHHHQPPFILSPLPKLTLQSPTSHHHQDIMIMFQSWVCMLYYFKIYF